MNKWIARLYKRMLMVFGLGVVVLATLLRLYGLGSSALWFDELATIEIATHPDGLLGVWQSLAEWRYPHPPLFLAILHLLFLAFDISEFTARIVPALSGILAVALLYRYVAELVSVRAALLGAFLLALSPYHIFYSQEARPYTLSFTVVIITFLVLRRALRTGGVKWWLAHTVCLTVLMYLHYFNACAVVGETLYVFVFWHKDGKKLGGYILSGAGAFLIFVPALLNIGSSTVVLNRTPMDISLLATLMTMTSGEMRYVSEGPRMAAFLVCSFLFVWGLIRLRKPHDVLALNLLPLLTAFCFVFVVLRAVGYVVPPYEDRQFMVVFPFLLTMVASGGDYLLDLGTKLKGEVVSLSRLRKCFGSRAFRREKPAPAFTPDRNYDLQRGLRYGNLAVVTSCALVILAVDALALNQYYFHFVKNADSLVAAHINARALPGDIVVCNTWSVATTMSVYGSHVPEYVAKPRQTPDGWEFSEQLAMFPDDGTRWTKTLADVLSHPRIWLVYLEGQGPEELTQELLGKTTTISGQRIGPFAVWLLTPR